MAISKRWLAIRQNNQDAFDLYRDTSRLLTTTQIAAELDTTYQTISHALKSMPEVERRALAALRYSASKEGEKNPMTGKTLEQHHNWKGECKDGHGYLTIMTETGRKFVHRIVAANMLGIAELPENLEPHHIDGDKENNHPDNLAIATHKGHKTIHGRELPESKRSAYVRLTLAAALRSTTSP